jgi:hypothetical protein
MLVGFCRANAKKEDKHGRRDARARRGGGPVPDSPNDM